MNYLEAPPLRGRDRKGGNAMQVTTFTITNTFGQKERREARVVRSVHDIPAGLGKVGTANGYSIWADRSLKMIEYAKRIYATKL